MVCPVIRKRIANTGNLHESAAFIAQFRNGLWNDIKDLLLTVEDPTSLNNAITKAVRCDNRSTASIGVPMQIDTIRFKPLSEEEKKRHRTNNLCLYCGKLGHIIRNCSKKNNAPPRIGALVVTDELSGKEVTQSQ
ncbi:98_t:CDS:2 [Dentiscutata heterogama]|uniref:98_t:CDS:1 n=1 Tax=Dentiscutata heterogama TaxID=1316150 RepID=A0ACA9KGA2_9GLOM|nr:98_t:CDS:2 [Dentiscutata heterogama]